jgi:kynurenine formamidase
MQVSGEPIDLAQPYFPGMPHFPTHPPFLFGMTKQHGEIVLPNGGSSAADAIAMGGHTGTHIDALNHFSCDGRLFGDVAAGAVQTWTAGVAHASVADIAPIVRRGVLLDIAGREGMDALPPEFVVTPDHLERALPAELRSGDVVLLRTGWARYFSSAKEYVNGGKMPGPAIDGARWLSQRKPFAVGSDTIAFEHLPSPEMAVHIHLLVHSGIHIIEVLNLEELATRGMHEFLFVAAPLKIQGGTGAPVRPLAFPTRTTVS